MRIHIGTDHAGLELKDHLVVHLEAAGHDVVDHGAYEYDALDDYPPFCISVGESVVAEAAAAGKEPGMAVVADEEASLGVVIGGSGNGEQLAANRVTGVRAILAWSLETARLGRQHNGANVVSVGGRMHSVEEATAIVEAFLAEPFSGDERHARRIGLMSAYEDARIRG